MFIFAGQNTTLLHISVNTAGMCNKTDKLMQMYGQYCTYFGVTSKPRKKEKEQRNSNNEEYQRSIIRYFYRKDIFE
jgi:hypothetical protein